MRHPCFFHEAYVAHYEAPHHLFSTSYEDEAPLNLGLVTISLSEAPVFYYFFMRPPYFSMKPMLLIMRPLSFILTSYEAP